MSQLANSLPVLMYHKISSGQDSDGLTVGLRQLYQQFNLLKQQCYEPISAKQLISFVKFGTPLPPKPVLITFDDGYACSYSVLYPVLQEFNFKAVIFIVPIFIDQPGFENAGTAYMTKAQIEAMDPAYVEFGLHSYRHANYSSMKIENIEDDINKNIAAFQSMKIPFEKVLAYPFGAYPKWNLWKQQAMIYSFKKNGIELAFRIGNRLNKLPFTKPYLIQRIDIRSDDPSDKFLSYLEVGKRKRITLMHSDRYRN